MTDEELRFADIAARGFMDFARRQVVRINLGEAFNPNDWSAHWTLIAVRAFRELGGVNKKGNYIHGSRSSRFGAVG